MKKILVPGDPGFYINRKRYHETEGDVRVGVEGIFTMRAIKPGLGVVRELSFPNLITNTGMDALGTNPNFNRMHLGTGTTTPDFTDTALTNFGVNVLNATPGRVYGVSPSSPYFGYTRLTWTSSVGGATGTWTEIGVSNQNTNGGLRSHALILDPMGAPTSFPVLSDEQFQGTYELRRYLPLSDSTDAILMSGDPYDATTRALRATTVDQGWGYLALDQGTTGGDGIFRGLGGSSSDTSGAYSGSLGAITDTNPSGTHHAWTSTAIVAAYGSGNFYQDTGIRFGSTPGAGSVKTVRFNMPSGVFQIEYDTAINKLATEELIHNQRVTWARI